MTTNDRNIIVYAEPEFTELPLALLHFTERNPRRITEKQFERLKRSLEEDPALLAGRPVLVNKRVNGEYYVMGGNMRVRAAQYLGWQSINCCVYDGLTEAEENRFVLKDNGHYGDWNLDELANYWAELPEIDLLDCGLPENLLDGLDEDAPGLADLSKETPLIFTIHAAPDDADDLLRGLKNFLNNYPNTKLEY